MLPIVIIIIALVLDDLNVRAVLTYSLFVNAGALSHIKIIARRKVADCGEPVAYK